MLPRYHDGDYTLICRWPSMHVKVGDVAVFKHMELGNIIKRIIEIDAVQGCLVAGENAHSISSGSIGWLPISSLMGKVIWHVAAKQ